MSRPVRAGFVLLPVVMALVVLAAIMLLSGLRGASLSAGAVSLGEAARFEETFRAARLRANWELDARQCGGYRPQAATLGVDQYSLAFSRIESSPVDLTLTARLQGGNQRIRRILREQAWDTPRTLQIVSSKATRISQESPNSNYGNDPFLKVGGLAGKEHRSLIQFDLSSLPAGVRIGSAQLRLSTDTVGLTGRQVTLRRVTQAWNEVNASWNWRDAALAWGAGGGTFDELDQGSFTVGATGTVTVDITPLAREWIHRGASNLGLLLTQASAPLGTETNFLSDDAASGRPSLSLTYHCECGSACSVDDYAACDSRYRANSVAAVHANALGTIEGAASVPAEFRVAGISFGADGGYVLVDQQTIYGYSSTGTLLGTCGTPSNVTGVTYVSAGPDRGKLVLVRSVGGGEARMIVIGASCGTERVVVPASLGLSYPTGVTYLRLEPGHPREHQIAIANASGLVAFTDAAGAAHGSIQPDFAPDTVSDITHVPNQEYLMFLDSVRNEMVTMDLAGRVVDRYDYGRFTLQNAAGVAVDMNSCAHIIASPASKRVAWLVRMPLSREPVAHWRLDEAGGVIANDVLGRNPGAVAAGATWQPLGGALQGALVLDAPGERVEVPNSPLLNPAQALSLTGWIRPILHDSGEPLVAKRLLNNRHQFWLGLVNGMPTFRFNDGVEKMLSSAAVLPLNTWAHLGATYDAAAGSAALFVNGARVATLPATLPLPSTSAPVRLGDDGFADTHASIDDLRLYDGALTDSDMLALYQASPAAVGGGSIPAPPTCNEKNVADSFSSVGFGLSTGSLPWTDPWEELGETDGPNAGDVRVQVAPQALQLQDSDNGGEGVRRRVDLSRFTSAKLSFRYARYALEADDYVTVSIGDGSEGGWVELGRIRGPGTDSTSSMLSMSFNLAGHRFPGRYIRFLTYHGMADNEGLYIDDVMISGCYQ